MTDLKLLGTYLNDHLAGSTVGVELARRAAGSNSGTELGEFLTGLAAEVEADRDTLRAIMQRLGVNESKVKVAAGWAGEKAGRLKANNALLGYSPLSRLIELEGLALGVEGKRGLWQVHKELDQPQLSLFDFDALIERARGQRDELQRQRLAAGLDAFREDHPIG